MRGKRGTYRKRASDAGAGRAAAPRSITVDDLTPYGREVFRRHGMELRRVGGALRAVVMGEPCCDCARPSIYAHPHKAKRGGL